MTRGRSGEQRDQGVFSEVEENLPEAGTNLDQVSRWQNGGSGVEAGWEWGEWGDGRCSWSSVLLGWAKIGRSPWRRVPDRSWEGGGEGAGRLVVRGPGSFSDTITGHRTPWPHSLQILHMNHSGYLLKEGEICLYLKPKLVQ